MFESPDEFVAPYDAEQRRYYFDRLIPRDIPIDHFISHHDGTFHLKSLANRSVYSHTLRMREPLSSKSPPFLQVSIKTDVATEYRAEKPQAGAVVVPSELGAGVGLFVAVGGHESPVEEFAAENQPVGRLRGPTFRIGHFRAALYRWPIWPDAELREDRPHGTLVSFRFLLDSGVFRHKTFVFA